MKILHINDYGQNSGAEKIYCYIFDNLGGEKISLNDYLPKNKVLLLLCKFFFSFKLYFYTKKILKDYVPDIILLHNINSSPFTLLFAIRKHKNIVQMVHDATQAGCPSAWTIYIKNYGKCNIKMNYGKCSRNCAYDKNKVVFFFYYFWLKYFLAYKKKIVRKYISPSIALRNILRNNAFKNAIALGNIIDYKERNIKKDKENLFLYVGAVDKRKGIDLLINAINELGFLKKNWKFVIIGEGDVLEELKQKYGNDSFYEFKGKLENDEVIKYFQKSKISFNPSIYFENFPTVALEGVLNECIVLGTSHGGLKEIVGEKNIFDILNKESIKDKILETIKNYGKFFNETLVSKEKIRGKMKTYFDDLERELID